MPYKIISLFAGAGGLDLGFMQEGFEIVWANEFDKHIWTTYEKNHHRPINKTDLRKVLDSQIPDCDGIIGGPPCQSWSEAGALRGIDDERGKLFFEFIRVLQAKRPRFFVAENVSGMLAARNTKAVATIKEMFCAAGYHLYMQLLNANDFGVAQDRKRVFYIGIRDDITQPFCFPKPQSYKPVLKDVIYDLKNNALPRVAQSNQICKIPNHEYPIGGFSTIYMSRNRVRGWEEPSFTIQASSRHAPIHPDAPKMVCIAPDRFVFKAGYEHLYRRLSVRECARIQGFQDDFIFYYHNISEAYKMIGNAVPVPLSRAIAKSIIACLNPNSL
ncbi:DNA (cytosine-5-)-methyltransferase [Helicobacter sp. 12S02634-8]|uniref:DNA cytosine methyltransferase n=1 Tax=Helicobacter sp. 12S02634-8 TaxID=1476199 RepID=UPI000BA59FBF|nr:DNA cytosine methyltransferase [Helicobacter sp. 12S02634-8]PAF47554.1 DNA (cytosine-5-)-methyltransferase [Helicobacter sp. 12S02634-8]